MSIPFWLPGALSKKWSSGWEIHVRRIYKDGPSVHQFRYENQPVVHTSGPRAKAKKAARDLFWREMGDPSYQPEVALVETKSRVVAIR